MRRPRRRLDCGISGLSSSGFYAKSYHGTALFRHYSKILPLRLQGEVAEGGDARAGASLRSRWLGRRRIMSQATRQRIQRLPPEVNRALYVRNLPFKITAEEMYDIFGKFGAIRQIRLGNAQDTRGTAFVVYEDIYDAKTAVDHLSGFNVCGRCMRSRRPSFACARPHRPAYASCASSPFPRCASARRSRGTLLSAD